MDSCLQQAMDEIKKATDGMAIEELAFHLEGKWSPAEILEHLTLSFVGTSRGMQRGLSDGNAKLKRSFRHRVMAFVVTDIGYMPSGRKAPKGVVPTGSVNTGAVGTILTSLLEMDTVLSEVERKMGRAARLNHPILGPLTIKQWRKFHLVHTRHHMKQIIRLRGLAS